MKMKTSKQKLIIDLFFPSFSKLEFAWPCLPKLWWGQDIWWRRGKKRWPKSRSSCNSSESGHKSPSNPSGYSRIAQRTLSPLQPYIPTIPSIVQTAKNKMKYYHYYHIYIFNVVWLIWLHHLQFFLILDNKKGYYYMNKKLYDLFGF